MSRYQFNCAFYATILALGVFAPSHAADPLLKQLEPQGGQRGTTVAVLLRGERLDDGPHQILWHKDGIATGEIEVVYGKQVRCQFRVADDCPLGPHALRLRTASGVSDLVTFHISNLQEMSELEPNDSQEQPQEIAMDVVINGVVKANDIDVYALDVTKGERLSVEIEGVRLGRMLFDPYIELRDAAGTLLAKSDDQTAAHQDAFVSHQVAKDERIFVHVRESAFRGANEATYRLHVGHFPRPTAVFPPVAVAGESVELQWVCDALGAFSTTVEVPLTESETYEVHATDDSGIAPSALPLYLAKTPPTLEVEPNDQRQEANELPTPGICCGVIGQPNDKDFYRFTLKKDQQYDLRIRARRLRSALDPVLHLYDPNGKYIKGNDDDAGHPDSFLRFKAPADGEYFLHVVDRLLRGREDMVYAVEISQPEPVVDLQLEERRRYRAQVVNIPQGGRTAAMIAVRRRDVSGPLQIEFAGLPAGCQATVEPLAGNYNRVPVLFTADEHAEMTATLATLTAKPVDKTPSFASHFQQQTWLVRGRNQVAVLSHFTDRAPVAVTNALPYSIRIVEPKAPLVRGGSMELKIVAQRDEGFEKPIAVRTIYNMPGMSTNQSLSIKQNETEVLVPITANENARTGQWKLAFLGKTNIRGGVEASSQLATVEIVEPFFDVAVPALTVVQGETTKLVVELTQRHPFTGKAELQLERLPPGVTANKTEVNADDKSATFQLTIDKDARIGTHRGVGCEVLLTVEGEPVRYIQGYAVLNVDPAPTTKSATHAESAGGTSS